MPSIYAHQKFGNDVRRTLPEAVRKKVEEHLDVFNIGLQGPDIFFYYHPLSWGEIPKYGNALHEKTGRCFFGEAIDRLAGLSEETEDEREQKATSRIYLCGVLCHYILDSTCHGFIDETEQSGVTTHAELEGDYDRHLIAGEGRDPVREILTKEFLPSRAAAEAIAVFYPEVSADIVEEALRSCVKFQKLVLCRSDLKRNFFYTVLKRIGKYESLHPHIMNKEADPACAEAEKQLDILYQEALPRAGEQIAKWGGLFEEESADKAAGHAAGPDSGQVPGHDIGADRFLSDTAVYERNFGGVIPKKQ